MASILRSLRTSRFAWERGVLWDSRKTLSMKIRDSKKGLIEALRALGILRLIPIRD